MIFRGEYTKLGNIKYISHLDLMRLFSRAFRRARVPVLYSEGFNPHPLFTLGNPLSLGVESESEFLEIEVEEGYAPEDFQQAMNAVLPEGVRILRVYEDFDKRAIQQQIASMEYSFTWEDEEPGNREEDLKNFLSREQIYIRRRRKKGRKKVEVEEDVRDRILSADIKSEDGITVLKAILSSGENNHLRPDHFLQAFFRDSGLNTDPDIVEIRRLKNFTEDGEEFHG